ncbi:MAG: LPS export ABC transporter permease LptG [Aliihoeflea sp.]|jgi:lipopolysaccharide export system permease protein|uniref:LPS export ABC transporter permease LptG n=1 Tax=Aliihoeflea sp. TaxID=2608088 RepID=UPI004033AE05
MIGRTLGAYFMRRYLIITFWFFTGIFGLIFIVNFTEVSRRVGDLPDYSLWWGVTFAALQTPFIMQQAVPFIALVSGIATLISLNRKYELVVARAAGISAWQFLLPICIGALLFGFAALFVLNPLASFGYERTQFLEADIRGGNNTPVAGGEAPWIKQRFGQTETYIGAAGVLDEGLQLVGATFIVIGADMDAMERFDAQRAFLRAGEWQLENARRTTRGNPPELMETVSIPTNLTPEFVLERLASPETIPIFQLPRKIAAARSFGLPANNFAMHMHSMLAMPALLVAMTLIAATVSMRFARMGQSSAMILGGVMAGFLLYVVTVLVKAFGSAGFVPPVAAAWFPVVVAGFFGVTFLLYREDG